MFEYLTLDFVGVVVGPSFYCIILIDHIVKSFVGVVGPVGPTKLIYQAKRGYFICLVI